MFSVRTRSWGCGRYFARRVNPVRTFRACRIQGRAFEHGDQLCRNGLCAAGRWPAQRPTIGGILTIAGFGAMRKHTRSVVPVMLGVVLGSLTKVWNINDPTVLLAALFG
ncbi:MAG: DUF1576 domain-containing protein [Eubacteriales bacterium]